MLTVLITNTHIHTEGGREKTFRGDGYVYGEFIKLIRMYTLNR